MIKYFTKFEKVLWIFSLIVVTASFIIGGNFQILNLIASLIGVTALIFLAKGHYLGQLLTVVFSFLYGIISFNYAYYGEVVTYLAMTAPMAFLAMIEWIKNPYKDSNEVEIGHMTKKKIVFLVISTIIITIVFYFILKYFGTANLFFSTLSIASSYVAAYLTYCRCELYAIAYSVNDVILIVLWILATAENSSYLTMVICFTMFLANDLYGYFNWKKMRKKQNSDLQ